MAQTDAINTGVSFTPPPMQLPPGIADAAVARARKWITEAHEYPDNASAKLLSKVLKSEGGLDFTVGFVDKVIRPEDFHIAAGEMAKLSKSSATNLPWFLRYPMKVGGAVAPWMPRIVVPITRRIFAQMVGDLVLDVTDSKLGPAISRLRANGARLNMNLLGEAVLGDKEAAKRLNDTAKLLARPDVEYVSLKVSAVTGPHNPWAFDQMVEKAVQALLPLYRQANSYAPRKFINLDMEEYKDLDLTIAVFKRILEEPDLLELPAGIVLQCYLPDALSALADLQEWSATRVARGGAPIKVRIVKGANLSMETVEAQIHDWQLTTQPSKTETDANYMRVLDYALRPEHTKNVRIGVAGMNLFTVAYAYELAQQRGILDINAIHPQVEFEMLSGMAAPQSQAVAKDTGHLLFYVPVVKPDEYDVAIAYLVRRLEENSASQNFMSAIFDLHDDNVLRREENRFRDALALSEKVSLTPNRRQNRLEESPEELASFMQDNGKWTFRNTPDSDPALPANREWAKQIQARMLDSKLGLETLQAGKVADEKTLQDRVARALKAAEEWQARPLSERIDLLHKVGWELAKRRGQLIEISGHEAAKAFDGADIEVSEAIDFAHYYAEQAKELYSQVGAKFNPVKLTLATPPWNFPIAIPCGSAVSALAAGSAVLFKPAPEVSRTGAVLAEAIWAAGIPEDLCQFIQIEEGQLGRQLISHPDVDRIVLTGSIETAKLFKSWNPQVGLLAETSGKNAIIVTPHADLDLAVKDLVNSAFGHCGQKCSASSLGILVGSVGTSKRFHNQLMDAVKSLVVDYPSNLASQTGALISPASGKLLNGLTKLNPGEKWAIPPKQLDETGSLWAPGVRFDVQPSSPYHLQEYFGPILGIIRCDTLEEAIEIQNATDYGLTAGLHSLDAEEINLWLDRVQAGNVYINRGITGAIVRRQPFGGWKRSAVGNGTKAGGPSYLFAFGEWERAEAPKPSPDQELHSRPLIEALKVSATLPVSSAESELLLTGLHSVQDAFDREYGIGHDPSDLGAERNVLRYRPAAVHIRLAEGESPWQLLLACAAGRTVGAEVSVSMSTEPPTALLQYLRVQHINYVVESDQEFLSGLATWADQAGLDARLRLIGGDLAAVNQSLIGQVDVGVYADLVTVSGRIEMLPFVKEQAVSFTNHRFGNHTPLSEEVEI